MTPKNQFKKFTWMIIAILLFSTCDEIIANEPNEHFGDNIEPDPLTLTFLDETIDPGDLTGLEKMRSAVENVLEKLEPYKDRYNKQESLSLTDGHTEVLYNLSLLGIALRSWNGKVRIEEARHLFSKQQWNKIVEVAFKPYWAIYRRYLIASEEEKKKLEGIVKSVVIDPNSQPPTTVELYPNYGRFILAALVSEEQYSSFENMMVRSKNIYDSDQANNLDILNSWKNVATSFICNDPNGNGNCETLTPSTYYLALLLASRPESYLAPKGNDYEWGENNRRNDTATLAYADRVRDINSAVYNTDPFDCTEGPKIDDQNTKSWTIQLRIKSCPGFGWFMKPYAGTALVNLAKHQQDQFSSLNNVFYLSLLANYESLRFLTELQFVDEINVASGLLQVALMNQIDITDYESHIYPGPGKETMMGRYYCIWAAKSQPARYSSLNEYDRLELLAIAYVAPRFFKLVAKPENEDFDSFSLSVFPNNSVFECPDDLVVVGRPNFIYDVNNIPNLQLNHFLKKPTMEEVWQGQLDRNKTQILDRSE